MSTTVDWDTIDLVIFDVDGTLYRQRPLRLRMALELASRALLRGDWRTAQALRHYRKCREELGTTQAADFITQQYALPSERTGYPVDFVRRVVDDWMVQKPLRHLAATRYPGVRELFEALARSGRSIGILSDYPAAAKLKTLGLEADIVVAADDEGVGALKPSSAGLEAILARTGITAGRALMVGDRADRDGAAAQAIGMRALIRSGHPHPDFPTFKSYHDPMFAGLSAAGTQRERRAAAAAHG